MPALLRAYELFIGEIPELAARQAESNANNASTTKPSADTKTIPAEGNFIKLTNHHFEATITFPREGKSNKTVTQTFKIYNPAPNTEQFIKTGNILILKAGYNTDTFLPIICATQIKKSFERRKMIFEDEAPSILRIPISFMRSSAA